MIVQDELVIRHVLYCMYYSHFDDFTGPISILDLAAMMEPHPVENWKMVYEYGSSSFLEFNCVLSTHTLLCVAFI